jgi:hypothetical protein
MFSVRSVDSRKFLVYKFSKILLWDESLCAAWV